ncbi:MAG: pyridoxal phosphate-dependent aminotransferase [Acidimicrobiaceae bacterium]|nr:pyridoxal phosphate-dependent aminotransferase [Acidimicrobiaceae bacterium]MDC1390405.1 pyridoxal phosphate-dependent aminotransferase [Acidimicrobiales bacterium]
MTSELSRRVGAIAPSATLAVSAKAKALKAEGKPVIGFGAGEPDFSTPAHIVEAAVEACRVPANHKYSPTPGLPALRAAIVAKTKRDSGYEITADQVVVTNGGKQAVYNALAALLNPGDEMLLPAPYWTTYPEPVRLAGATPVELQTSAESGFRVTVEQLEAARTENTKALMFVSPSNPTGAVYRKEEIEAIGRWAVEHDIWVLCDEIYEHLVYGEAVHYSMPVLVPELADRCIILNGVAKTYAMTGWRVGWIIGPVALVKAASTLQSHQTSNVCNVAQAAALAAVSGSLDAVHEMHAAFDRRRQTIHTMLNEISGVSCINPEGAFYAFPSFHDVLGREIDGVTPTTTAELADLFLEKINVAIVPGEAFSAPGYGRMSYALSDEDLIEGVTRMADLLGRK